MPEALLAVNELHAGYGATEILRGVSFMVQPGEVVAILGSNGTGKSTLNRTLSGVMRPWHGTICFGGDAIERQKPSEIVASGLIHVPEGRRIFPNMTVRENLDLGAYRRSRVRRAPNRDRVFADLNILAAESKGLSGGDILNVCLNSIYAGSTADDAREWKVTGTELLAEVAKVRSAQNDHRTSFCRETTHSA